MSVQDLGNELCEMYNGADKGSAVVMIHFFGIKFASQIRENGAHASDIVRVAGMNDSYVTEIQKGIRLAEFVDVKASV